MKWLKPNEVHSTGVYLMTSLGDAGFITVYVCEDWKGDLRLLEDHKFTAHVAECDLEVRFLGPIPECE